MRFLVGFAVMVLGFRFYKKFVNHNCEHLPFYLVSFRCSNHSWASDTWAFVPHTTFDKPLRFHICLTLKSDLVLVYNLISLENVQKLNTSKSQNRPYGPWISVFWKFSRPNCIVFVSEIYLEAILAFHNHISPIDV